MKQLIDFDTQFNEYMDSWADKLLKEGKKAEEIIGKYYIDTTIQKLYE